MDDPRKVGGRYRSGYWQEEYTVIAITTMFGVPVCTVQWAHGLKTSHQTAWSPRYDTVIYQPLTYTAGEKAMWQERDDAMTLPAMPVVITATYSRDTVSITAGTRHLIVPRSHLSPLPVTHG